jgi:hypothetical protein
VELNGAWQLYFSAAGDMDQPYVYNSWPMGLATFPKDTTPISQVLKTHGPVYSTELSAFPNPFSASIVFQYSLPKGVSGRYSIYNISGQRIFLQEMGKGTSGAFRWNSRDLQGKECPVGCYLGRLETSQGKQIVNKLLFLK